MDENEEFTKVYNTGTPTLTRVKHALQTPSNHYDTEFYVAASVLCLLLET